jgi:predicted alpha-1,6-mannanase (GH76 family)
MRGARGYGCGLGVIPLAHAANKPAVVASVSLPSSSSVFQDWNNAFLVQQGDSTTYYANGLKTNGNLQSDGGWTLALDIAVAEDAYDRTRTAANLQLVKKLIAYFLKSTGTNWLGDPWNDDIGWQVNAVLRGYQITDETSLLNIAISQWNGAYNRGWSDAGGGGIWEVHTDSKCGLSNDSFVWEGVSLYQITGDSAYLAKAEQIYNWVRTVLFPASGPLSGCIGFPDGPNGPIVPQHADNAYDAGTFMEAGDALYRATGNKEYSGDALRTANRYLDNVKIVSNNGGNGTSYQYWLFKGMDDIATDTGTWSKYAAYVESNAAQAWSVRNSMDLTGNNWTAELTDPDPDAFRANGMPGIFQDLPVTGGTIFHGAYHLKNAASHKLISVAGGATANNAPIVDGTAAASDSWSFVLGSNGHYSIRNARSGKLINVADDSEAPGARVVQWPAQGLVQGNDQWQPAHNANGTWSFYNRNSGLALTVASSANGAQLVQKPQDNSAAQQFILTKSK